MKVTIPVEVDIPDGYEFVAVRKANKDEEYIFLSSPHSDDNYNYEYESPSIEYTGNFNYDVVIVRKIENVPDKRESDVLQ